VVALTAVAEAVYEELAAAELSKSDWSSSSKRLKPR
jgi:hypothetical protein